MAKRYHQSVRDRLAESRGMERRNASRVEHARDKFNDERRKDKDGYNMAGDPGENYFPSMSGQGRRAIEKPEMIYEDNRAIANLPQEVMIKPYARTKPYIKPDLDDTGRGIDEQMDFDDSQRKAHFYPKKV